MTMVSQPRVVAAIMGTLVKGMEVDRVCRGTDAAWTSSPQWQIEGLRRLLAVSEAGRPQSCRGQGERGWLVFAVRPCGLAPGVDENR